LFPESSNDNVVGPGFGKAQNRMTDICKAGLLPIMFVVSAS
jgi:hypothetical protein